MIINYRINVEEVNNGFELHICNQFGNVIGVFPETFSDLETAIYTAIIWARKYNIQYCFY